MFPWHAQISKHSSLRVVTVYCDCGTASIIYLCKVALSAVQLMESPDSTNRWRKKLYWPDLVVEVRDSFFSNAVGERLRESLMPLRHASPDISHLACLCFFTEIFMVRVCSEDYSYSSLLICVTRLRQATLVSAHYFTCRNLNTRFNCLGQWRGGKANGIFNPCVTVYYTMNKWSLRLCMEISTANLHCGG